MNARPEVRSAVSMQRLLAATSAAGLVVMVRLGIELRCVVALRAEPIAFELQLERMRIVTIRALHVVRMHLALQKRPVLIHLILDLAIGIIEAQSVVLFIWIRFGEQPPPARNW